MTELQAYLSVTVDIRGNRAERDLRDIAADAVRDVLKKAKLGRKRCKIEFNSLSVHVPDTTPKPKSYPDEARDDAANMADEFIDAIVESLIDDGEAGKYVTDYLGGDRYHDETHKDKWYNLSEAADVLSALADYKETDAGMWESLEPDKAIEAQAAHTYGNAVAGMFQELIGKINDAYDMLTVELDAIESDATERRERLEELEAMDKRDRDEYNEMRQLRRRKASDTEEAVETAKAARVRHMVAIEIGDFR